MRAPAPRDSAAGRRRRQVRLAALCLSLGWRQGRVQVSEGPTQHGRGSGFARPKGTTSLNILGRENVQGGQLCQPRPPLGLCRTLTHYPGFRTPRRPDGPPLSVPVTSPSAQHVRSQEAVSGGRGASSSLRV